MGERDERVGGMEEREVEEEEERGFGRGSGARPCGNIRVTATRPDWLQSLMEVDLESLLPLTDSDCSVNNSRTHSHALSPRPQSAGGSHTCIIVYRCALHILTHTYCMCALKSHTKHQDFIKGSVLPNYKKNILSYL